MIIAAEPDITLQMSRLEPMMVNLVEGSHHAGLTTVCADNRAHGAMAADYLWNLGYRSLAYLAMTGLYDSDARQEGFVRRLAELECNPKMLCFPMLWGFDHWDVNLREVGRLIAELPRPLGLFCFSDFYSMFANEAAHWQKLRVPEDVAIIGVDDNDSVCEVTRPTLSSINPDYYRIGYEAAAQLDRLIRGIPAPTSPIFIPPSGVTERASTDIAAVDDEEVADALRFIRRNIASDIGPADVLAHVQVSRRSLDGRFVRHVGRTVKAEIDRCRTDRAIHLLRETPTSVTAIAEQLGFSDPSHFVRAIRSATGKTPTQVRAESLRLNAPARSEKLKGTRRFF